MILRRIGSVISLPFSTLSATEAQLRTKIVSPNTVRYNSHLILHKGNNYDGLTNICFEAQKDINSPSGQNLRIDFQGKFVTGLMINEQELSNPSSYHKNGAITIPRDLIHFGKPNNIAVRYQNDYNQDGNGCVSFIDTDQKQYLYTQFEPYYANRVFPLFDQPDLKAPFSLSLACPEEWQAVLSNQFQIPKPQRTISICSITAQIIAPYLQKYKKFTEVYEQKIPQKYKVTSFLPTLPISTYLYCFVVGPYKELIINKNPQKDSLKIPMRLYSIESLYPEMIRLAPYIEQITVQSMDFFQEYFGYKYPFSKYDQVFAHEYKWGAMENAGIVTFNDSYLFKDKVSDERMLSFGNTIVHELSHHWFGNLVTMKWWDDLWLNESFAQYISHFCLQKIKGNLKTISYESAMLSFFNRKVWGYAEDELVTTHPIRSEVPNTLTAESIFDGITYSKGAATMKQLMYLIGEDAFSKALSAYFKKYEFSNAVLDDLLSSMNKYFQKSKNHLTLNEWKQMWLETAGTNKLFCEWKPGQTEATILQSIDRPECKTLRLHRIKVGIVLNNHSILTRDVTVLPQEKTIVTLDVPKEAVAVLLNYDDYSFAKAQLDGNSRVYFQQNLNKLESSVSRCLIWKSYWDMVKDCRITSEEFVSFCLSNLNIQKSDPIFQDQLSKLHSAVSLYTPKVNRSSLYSSTFSFLQKLLLELPENAENANRKVIIRQKLIDFCHSSESAQLLFKWYYNQPSSLGQQSLNNTLRWKIVMKLFSRTELSNAQKWQLFNDMKNKDSSDVMVNRKFACQAFTASQQQLETIYQNFFKKQDNRSLTNFVYQLKGFNHEIHQKIIRQKYLKRYFEDVGRLLKGSAAQHQKWLVQGDYLQSLLVHFDPVIDGTVGELQAKRDQFTKFTTENAKIKRNILKMIDVLERRIRTYKLFESKVKG